MAAQPGDFESKFFRVRYVSVYVLWQVKNAHGSSVPPAVNDAFELIVLPRCLFCMHDITLQPHNPSVFDRITIGY